MRRLILSVVTAGAALLILSAPSALAQQHSGPGGGRGGQSSSPAIGPQAEQPRGLDPEAHDAIDLFSHLCVSTRGDRAVVAGIIGEGDTAVEKMDEKLLRGLENGKPGGVGWIIRMPLGEKLLIDLPAGGACVVRAPRVESAAIEGAFRNLLDQYAASGQFTVRRAGEQTKIVDIDGKPYDDGAAAAAPAKDGRGPGIDNRPKFHFVVYRMEWPDPGKAAELALAATDSRLVSIQATLSFSVLAGKP
jgi:hypothetical protein